MSSTFDIFESRMHGYDTVVCENEFLRVEIIPSRGSKIVSFVNKQSNKEWVFQNDRPWEPLHYGMDWGDGDRMGWDEMFPTILPCHCPDQPWDHVSLPDHGEVWCIPWQYELINNTVRMWVSGVQIPYLLEKVYRLEGKDMHIEYKLTNPTPFALSYLWAAHFLLDVEPGTQLITEPELDSIIYYYSHMDRLSGLHERASYPVASKGDLSINLNVTEAKLDTVAEKYWFEQELREGYAGVRTPEGETLTYRFAPEDVPYLAVWANYGAFWSEYNLALEPATGFLDDVSLAKSLNKVKRVDAHSSNQWVLIVSI